MTLKENIVLRLVGLFIFLAPNKGGDFMADCFVKVYQRLGEEQRQKRDRAMAA